MLGFTNENAMLKTLKYYLFCLIICFNLIAVGEQPKIDSLLNLLKVDKVDTNKLVHMYHLCSQYRAIGNKISGLNYCNQTLSLADVIINQTTDQQIRQTAKCIRLKPMMLWRIFINSSSIILKL